MEMEALLKQITESAPVVAEQHEALQNAIATERSAEAELLARVIEAARPALVALLSRPQIGYRSWWVGSVRTESKIERADWIGVCVDDDAPGPGRGSGGGRDQNRGAYEGRDLFLLGAARMRVTDGKWVSEPPGIFVELNYDGSWSCWQGEGDQWSATQRTMTLEQVVAEYDVETIVSTLAKRLAKHAQGARPAKTKAAHERAGRFLALAALIR